MTSLMTLSQHKNQNYVKSASLKSETTGKMKNRILGSISSLPGSALRMHVDSLGKPHDTNKRSQSLAL